MRLFYKGSKKARRMELSFGEWLRKIRKERGLSQADLAKELGVHDSYVAHVEAGQRIFSFAVLKKISERFKLPLSRIAKMTKDYEPPKNLPMKVFDVECAGKKLHVLARTREDAMEIGLDWASKGEGQ